jgi:hypothetical protein
MRCFHTKVIRKHDTHAETIASKVPGAHKLQGGIVFITRVVQLLHAPYALVLLTFMRHGPFLRTGTRVIVLPTQRQ